MTYVKRIIAECTPSSLKLPNMALNTLPSELIQHIDSFLGPFSSNAFKNSSPIIYSDVIQRKQDSKFDAKYKNKLLEILIYWDVLCLTKISYVVDIYNDYRRYVNKILRKLEFGMDIDEVYSVIIEVFRDLKDFSDMGYNLDDCYDMAEDISLLFD